MASSYQPTWDSLKSRPLPSWYEESKFGLIVHWGPYSVPAYHNFDKTHRKSDFNGSEWYWYRLKKWNTSTFGYGPVTKEFHEANYGTNFDYRNFGNLFQAANFQPQQWAQIFKNSGAKYVILTAKHHDGYCLWDAPNSGDWNSVQSGPRRDLVQELSTAVRSLGLKFGVYYSLYEWFNPLYLADKRNKTTHFISTIVVPQITDLINRYSPHVLWLDGHWEQTAEYWHIRDIMAWCYNHPVVGSYIIINDRLGKGLTGQYGDVFNYEDRWGPAHPKFNVNKALSHKWENVMTMSRSWGVNNYQQEKDWKSSFELLQILISTVAYGGNLLLNVGPTASGELISYDVDRLTQLGFWLQIFGESVYGTSPCPMSNMLTTCRSKVLYIFMPAGQRTLSLPSMSFQTVVSLHPEIPIQVEGNAVILTQAYNTIIVIKIM